MNNVNLIGRLTKDVELRRTDSGKEVCSFCIAIDGGQDRTYFIDCVAWEARATNISTYFRKGDKIGIAGMITTRQYQDKDGNNRKAVEVLVNSFDFCNGKKTDSQPAVEDAVSEQTETVSDLIKDVANNLPFEV